MSEFHLATIDIARWKVTVNDPQAAGFFAKQEYMYALAERSPGFVWQLKSDGRVTGIPYGDDPHVTVNMSVWASVETYKAYFFSPRNPLVLSERNAWFVKPDTAFLCFWWIPAGEIPTLEEGRKRLEYFNKNNATPYAFWFAQMYPPSVAFN